MSWNYLLEQTNYIEYGGIYIQNIAKDEIGPGYFTSSNMTWSLLSDAHLLAVWRRSATHTLTDEPRSVTENNICPISDSQPHRSTTSTEVATWTCSTPASPCSEEKTRRENTSFTERNLHAKFSRKKAVFLVVLNCCVYAALLYAVRQKISSRQWRNF